MGEQIGYSVQGIKFNITLFAICLMISSILFVVCIKTVKKEEEQKAEEKQLKILEAYIKNLEQLNEKTSAFRHDYKNILSGLSGFLKEGKTEEMTAYLSEIIHATEKISEGQDLAWKELRYVYPLELKGFLYEKILSAYAQKIRMQIQVDEKLDFKCSYMKDVIRILGIFIDNAIEETRNIENGYIIIVAMNTEQGCLFSIANNYKKKPALSLMQQQGYTTKGENHGMGLYWAEEMIKKHEVIHNVIGTLEKGLDLEKMQWILNIEKVTEDECHKCWAYSECSGCIRFGNNCREDLKKLILKKCPEIKGNVENAFKDFTVLCELGYDFDKLDC